VIKGVSWLRLRSVSIVEDLLSRSVVVSVDLSLISVRLRSIWVGVRVPIVVSIVEPDLNSGVSVRSNNVIVAIDSKTKTAVGSFHVIVVAIHSQSTIGRRDNELIVVTVYADNYFAVSDDKGVIIAMYIKVGLFVFDIDSTVAARIVHFFTFIYQNLPKSQY
jgi:hypothetical protein